VFLGFVHTCLLCVYLSSHQSIPSKLFNTTGAMHDCTTVKLSKHINDAHSDAVDNAQAMHKNTPVH